jgi:hypothetical protein
MRNILATCKVQQTLKVIPSVKSKSKALPVKDSVSCEVQTSSTYKKVKPSP